MSKSALFKKNRRCACLKGQSTHARKSQVNFWPFFARPKKRHVIRVLWVAQVFHKYSTPEFLDKVNSIHPNVAHGLPNALLTSFGFNTLLLHNVNDPAKTTKMGHFVRYNTSFNILPSPYALLRPLEDIYLCNKCQYLGECTNHETQFQFQYVNNCSRH